MLHGYDSNSTSYKVDAALVCTRDNYQMSSASSRTGKRHRYSGTLLNWSIREKNCSKWFRIAVAEINPITRRTAVDKINPIAERTAADGINPITGGTAVDKINPSKGETAEDEINPITGGIAVDEINPITGGTAVDEINPITGGTAIDQSQEAYISTGFLHQS